MGKHEKGRGGFRSPGMRNSEEKKVVKDEASPSVSKGAVGATPPKQLSEKITSMKFMQKKAAAVSAGSDALKPVARGVAERVSGQGETSVIHLDGEGSPLVRHFPGRRSFGKFNATIEEYATGQIKIFRRAEKDIARGGPLVKAESKQIEIENVTGKARRDETKDVSDQEMARVLGKHRQGGHGDQGKTKAARLS
mmetsp:Transcript_103/g.197  ORF Transcript_103/g.197 Transcript_103/m.197 type:complete len:195 (+) Transcript_103:139-723(+)